MRNPCIKCSNESFCCGCVDRSKYDKWIAENKNTKQTTKKESKLKSILKYAENVKNYVYLREDEKGPYLTYAFIDGNPEHNRCISKNTLKQNMGNPSQIFWLSQYNCNTSEGRCFVGNPHRECLNFHTDNKPWSLEYPEKQCGTWSLSKQDKKKITFNFSINDLKKYIKE